MLVRSLFLVVAALLPNSALAGESITWTRGDTGDVRVQLYFFWSQQCPHCLRAVPFIESIDREHSWLEVHSAELSRNRSNVDRYIEMARLLGQEASSVPAFFICGRMITGYDSPKGVGDEILQLALACRQSPNAASLPAEQGRELMLPFLGGVDPQHDSLLLLTAIIAGMDSFNPCAFFVLLFLMSLMVHARSRARMLLIGTTFVTVSAVVYFIFMAAWLNLFIMIGTINFITVIAGGLAVVIGALNTRDYFRYTHGPTLAIPESAKPSLFRRMRGLLKSENLTTMLLSTAALAVAANSYELLCTAGFPMVYTRMLTLNELGRFEYYGYLVVYNLIYVLPLLLIVLAFSLTLGSYKLTEQQGRILKLLSGLMMLGLGAMMLLAPDALLATLWSGLALLLSAVAATFLIHWLSTRIF